MGSFDGKPETKMKKKNTKARLFVFSRSSFDN